MPIADPIAKPDPTIERKAQLRAEVLARRDAMAPAARADAVAAVLAHPFPVAVQAGQIVSGFSPIRTEINPLPLMRRCAEQGAILALPAIAGRGRPLAMRVWEKDVPLVRGQWGIREPRAEAPEVIPDIMIVPLATFDRRGNRIGYGAGYYDMTIAAARAHKPAVAIGLAFATQESEDVPAFPHDQPLDFVLTEREVIVCRRS
ncbi:MAG: 5-formyltetrahydrofolate cyclo-ligase [Rhizobiales bacterium]|nr:5-formyltetrahydrofolate cyclo-ligase [Hyphomicrobiales bacterium]